MKHKNILFSMFMLLLFFSLNTATAQTSVSISDIQKTENLGEGDSPYKDSTITTKGVVTAVVKKGDGSQEAFVLQDGTGAWNGIYVYNSSFTATLGDSVSVTGKIIEYYGLTEITDVSAYNILSQGATIPEPVEALTDSLNHEKYESVLVATVGTCDSEANNYGEWTINDGSGTIMIDDKMYAHTPKLNSAYNVTGILSYSFSKYRVYPRFPRDIVEDGMVSIKAIQMTDDLQEGDSPFHGETVKTKGIVTAVILDEGNPSAYFIQDGAEMWSGIYVYDNTNTVTIGDEITVIGEVEEYYGLTEIKNVTNVTILSSDNTLPEPVELTNTNDVNAEACEGVLVSTTGACTSEPNNYGEWEVNDGSGAAMIDDVMYAYTPELSNEYTVVGPVTYSYSRFRVLPRSESDVMNLSAGGIQLSIAQIQKTDDLGEGPSPYKDSTVTTTGVITAIVKDSENQQQAFVLQDGAGAWNGIYVYDQTYEANMGDSVKVTGLVGEYYDFTQLQDLSAYTVLAEDVEIPAPVVAATDSLNQEKYESVLVATSGTCDSEANNYGEWSIDDGTGSIGLDDKIFAYTPKLGSSYEVTGIINYSFGAYKIYPRFPRDIIEDGIMSIQAIQMTDDQMEGDSPLKGQSVTTTGIITAINADETEQFGYYIQNGAAKWSGVYVFDKNTTVNEGDSIVVTGTVSEYYGCTQVDDVTEANVISSDNTIPTAYEITTNEVNSESVEGVLIVTTGICDNADLGYGEWSINDGTGAARADDALFAFTPEEGTSYTVTGPVDYSFSNYKIRPRKADDIVIGTSATVVTIAEIQETDSTNGNSPYLDQIVRTHGVVTAILTSGSGSQQGYFLQDGTGAWSGIYVYSPYSKRSAEGFEATVGDSVFITGLVEEYNGITEIKDVEEYTIISSGVTLPEPDSISNAQVNSEEYESVLVKAAGSCTKISGDYWEIYDGADTVSIYNRLFSFIPALDEQYVVSGPNYYYYNNFRIMPRSRDDIIGQEGELDPTDYTIAQVQTTADGQEGDSPLVDEYVRLLGVVTAIVSNSEGGQEGYFLQDGSTPWSGIYVYDPGSEFEATVGDSVHVTGTIMEYFGLTELSSVTNYEVVESGVELPAPIVASTGELNHEKYEGVLVNTSGTCDTADLGYGEWSIDDGSGHIRTDDKIFAFVPIEGEYYDVTGPLTYTYENYKIFPRNEDDIIEGQASVVSIYDIQKTADGQTGPSPKLGELVTTYGVVTAIELGRDGTQEAFFIMDSSSAWNGLYVYDDEFDATIGDSVEITGTIDEYYDLTEMKDLTDYVILASGVELPAPVTAPMDELNHEKYEGVLVTAEGLCIAEADEFGEWLFADDTDTLMVGDDIYAYTPTLFDQYSVTGPLTYTYSAYKIFPRNADDVTYISDTEEDIMPTVYSLDQNYPNPFNPTTTIRYAIPEAGNVNLVIYDVLGNKVATLVDKQQTAGVYSASFDASNLATGLYIYRITVNNFMETRKMMLLK